MSSESAADPSTSTGNLRNLNVSQCIAEAIGLPRVIQPLLRIDYIWHSDELRAASARVGEDIGSDHLPLTAEFEWRFWEGR